MIDDPKSKPEMDSLSSKFVWDEDDVGGITVDNSEADGESIDFNAEAGAE